MKQLTLADLIGTTDSMISGYETGRWPIPPARLEAIAAALEKPVAWFKGEPLC